MTIEEMRKRLQEWSETGITVRWAANKINKAAEKARANARSPLSARSR